MSMINIDLHEAEAQLGEIIKRVANGERIVITKDGKPVAEVVPADAATDPRRLGFLAGEIEVPDDFNRMAETEIEARFRNGG